MRRSEGRWLVGVDGSAFQEQSGKGQLWLVGVPLVCPAVDTFTDAGYIGVVEGGDVVEDFLEFG